MDGTAYLYVIQKSIEGTSEKFNSTKN